MTMPDGYKLLEAETGVEAMVARLPPLDPPTMATTVANVLAGFATVFALDLKEKGEGPALAELTESLAGLYEAAWRLPATENGEPSKELMFLASDMTRRLQENGLRFSRNGLRESCSAVRSSLDPSLSATIIEAAKRGGRPH